MDFIIEQLDTALHNRKNFDCGVEELNVFLKQHANQNQSKNMSKTYVAVVAVSADNQKKIYGYYTLSAGHIECDQLPDSVKSKLPKYPIPIARIGRLAVDKNYRGQGIGGWAFHRLAKVMGVQVEGVEVVVAAIRFQQRKRLL